MDETPPPAPTGQAGEVLAAFLRQGATAFGGAAAQVAAFRREFVERRAWLDERAFAELLALAQLLPGPPANTLGMAIGLRRAGWRGMVAAAAGFVLPAGLAMAAFGLLLPELDPGWGDGVIRGLKIACAALLAQAVVALARPLAGDPIRAGVAVGAAAGLLAARGPAAEALALAAGAVFGLAFLREPDPAAAPDDPKSRARPRRVPLAIFAAALAGLPVLAAALQSPSLALASVAYRIGALSFAQGQSLLPLFHGEVVARGWLERDALLSGYGAVGALPGPSLALAAFVGTAQTGGGWTAAVLALAAIVAPGALLVAGLAPAWSGIQRRPGLQAAAAGVNAAALGLLGAALWNPGLTGAIERPSDWLLAAGAFVFLAVARVPAWLVVLGLALAMALVHPPVMSA